MTASFVFEPGERYLYCNTGYILLGAVIEAVSGQPYETFLRAAFFEPLGMARTGLCLADSIIPLRARGYVRGRSGFHNARPDRTIWSHSAGGLCSTLGDLAIWDRALREGRVLRRESFEAMIEPTRLANGFSYPYGFGWGTATYADRRLHHHTGGVSGFACQMARLTDQALTVIVLSNLYLFPFDRVTRGLLRQALNLAPVQAPWLPMNADVQAACMGRYRDNDDVEVVIGPGGIDVSRFTSLGEGRCCDPDDPEVEFQFSNHDGKFYHTAAYVSPLWPTRRHTRAQSPEKLLDQ